MRWPTKCICVVEMSQLKHWYIPVSLSVPQSTGRLFLPTTLLTFVLLFSLKYVCVVFQLEVSLKKNWFFLLSVKAKQNVYALCSGPCSCNLKSWFLPVLNSFFLLFSSFRERASCVRTDLDILLSEARETHPCLCTCFFYRQPENIIQPLSPPKLCPKASLHLIPTSSPEGRVW